MQSVDLLIDADWVLPMTAGHPELAQHSIAVRDGKIVAVLPSAEAGSFVAAEHHSLPGHALMPGLVNAHTHAAMNLFRGMADGQPLMTWLEQHIWPAEARVVSEDFVRDGTRVAIAEMLLSGTTCFNDMYMFPDAAAKAAGEAGIRACLGLIVLDFPTAWASNADEYITKGLSLYDELKYQSRLTAAFAPHAPYTVSDAPLQRVQTLADELDIPVHIHVHETTDEVEQALANHGRRPLAHLAELGLLTPRLMAVHMTQVVDADVEAAANHNINVVHCPESNAKLASGMCPVARLDAAGVNVALGTDGAASNNNLDMLGELRSAALIGKLAAQDACAVPAELALRMATVNGARALGLDEHIGTLESGKCADLVAIDLRDISNTPVYDVSSALVYAASKHQVAHVWIDGQHVVAQRQLLTLDVDALMQTANKWRDRITAPD